MAEMIRRRAFLGAALLVPVADTPLTDTGCNSSSESSDFKAALISAYQDGRKHSSIQINRGGLDVSSITAVFFPVNSSLAAALNILRCNGFDVKSPEQLYVVREKRIVYDTWAETNSMFETPVFWSSTKVVIGIRTLATQNSSSIIETSGFIAEYAL